MRILLLADEGLGKEEISKKEQVYEQTVYNTLKKTNLNHDFMQFLFIKI